MRLNPLSSPRVDPQAPGLPPLRRCGLIRDKPTGADFSALCLAYRSRGGLGRGEDLARQLASRGLGGLSSLGRSIERRQVFSVRWMGEHWLPLFQFDLRDLSTSAGLRPVLAELERVYGEWDIATWFVQPNDLLNGVAPIDHLAADAQEVAEVARGDRLIAECRRTN